MKPSSDIVSPVVTFPTFILLRLLDDTTNPSEYPVVPMPHLANKAAAAGPSRCRLDRRRRRTGPPRDPGPRRPPPPFDELRARRVDVGDDQVQALNGAGRRADDPDPEGDRA